MAGVVLSIPELAMTIPLRAALEELNAKEPLADAGETIVLAFC